METTYKQITDYLAQYPLRNCPFDVLSSPTLRADLLALQAAGRISLRPWTGALSDCPQPELIIEQGQGFARERKYYAMLRR